MFLDLLWQILSEYNYIIYMLLNYMIFLNWWSKVEMFELEQNYITCRKRTEGKYSDQ